MRSATYRQRQILAAVFLMTQENGGIAPTIAEVSERLGMTSACGAQTGIQALKRKEMLHMIPKKARALQLTDKGLQALSVTEG